VYSPSNTLAGPVTATPAAAGARPLSTTVVTDAAAFDAMAAEWNALVERCGIPHPFVLHQWLRTWWTCCGAPSGATLHLVTVRDGDTLVAAAPMMRERTRLYGLPVERVVSLHNDHTPRSELLVDPACPQAAQALWAALRPRGGRRLLEVRELPTHVPMLARVRALAASDGLRTGTWDSNGSPYLRIEGTWADYQAGLSDKLRGNIRRRAKNLARQGEVVYEVVAGGDLRTPLDDGLRIEAAGWKGGLGTAINCHPALVRLYREFAEVAAAHGWLRLLFVKVGDRRIAFTYAIEYANRLFLVKRGYDPEFASSSPTQLQMLELLRDAYERRLTAVEFLGASDPWKLEWTRTVRQHQWLHVFPPSLAGRALHAAKYQLAPALRRHGALAGVRRLVLRGSEAADSSRRRSGSAAS
jgi:CelD/BcsL family acetyltransferase involved in cellulose biosynthesis